MALDLRRRRARRRLAAIAFLSEITLEGSNHRLKSKPLTKCEAIPKTNGEVRIKPTYQHDLKNEDQSGNVRSKLVENYPESGKYTLS